MSGMANPQPMVTLQSVKRVLARSPIQAGMREPLWLSFIRLMTHGRPNSAQGR